MSADETLLQLLADGRFHSGEQLAQHLGVSRAAVWKRIEGLRALGLEVQAVSGKGYRLARALELLQTERVREELGCDDCARLRLECLYEVDSTSDYLLRLLRSGERGEVAVVAERQLAGRGRRGRSWVSPFGANLYLSLLSHFTAGPAALMGLSLVAGVAVVRAIEALGAAGAGLKWPNDVMWQGRKMGGILLDVSGEANGPSHVVTGVGLNVAMPRDAAEGIDQPWVDIKEAGGQTGRNRIAGRVLAELCEAMQRFQQDGLAPFLAEWNQRDSLAGREVVLSSEQGAVTGIARGVDGQGFLRLETAGGVKTFSYGELSLRPLDAN